MTKLSSSPESIELPRRPTFRQRKVFGFSQLGHVRATLYIAFSTLIMAYSGLFGFVPILIFFALWFPLWRYRGARMLKFSPELLPLILLGGFAVCSTVWSDYRMTTLKGALEYCSMIVVTILVSRIVSVKALIDGVCIGIFLVLVVLFRTGSYSFDGLFGSKNVVGIYAELGLFGGALALFGRKHTAIRALVIFPILGLSAWCLVLSQSGTSVVSLVVALGVCCAGYFIGRLPQRLRVPAFISATTLMFLAVVVGYLFNWQSTGLSVLGKDSTLTGRTYLWSEGVKYGATRPLGGFGYEGFWVIGRPEAENLWFKFGIVDRSGFHFHNLFINTFVELGFIGLAIMIYIYGSTFIKAYRFFLSRGGSVETLYILGITVMFLTRAFAEIDTFGPFGMGPLLFFSLSPLMTAINVNTKLTLSQSTVQKMAS